MTSDSHLIYETYNASINFPSIRFGDDSIILYIFKTFPNWIIKPQGNVPFGEHNPKVEQMKKLRKVACDNKEFPWDQVDDRGEWWIDGYGTERRSLSLSWAKLFVERFQDLYHIFLKQKSKNEKIGRAHV